MARKICTRLRTSERLREFLAAITRHHLVLGFLVHERPLSKRAVYRYLKLCSPVEVEVTLLTCADRIATRGKNAEAAIEAHLELARELMSAALRLARGRAAARRRCAATSWRTSSASSPAPIWAACSASSRRPATPAR